MDAVFTLPAASPSGPTGTVKIVEVTLVGSPVIAFSAGAFEQFNHAISLVLTCDTQAEIDRIWDGLLDGGTSQQCGWLRDRFGLYWQITPRRLLQRNGQRPAASNAAIAGAGSARSLQPWSHRRLTWASLSRAA